MPENDLHPEEVSKVRKRVDNTHVTVMLRPFASTTSLANFAFAIGNLIYGAFLVGWIPKDEASTVAILLLGFVAPLQIFPSIMAFILRDGGGGTAFGVFGVAWIVQAIDLLRSGGDKYNAADGIYLLGVTLCLAAIATVVISSKPLLGILVAVATLRTIGLAGIKFGFGSPVRLITGAVGLVLTVIALYSGFVFLREDMQLKPSPLTFRTGEGKKAMEGRTEDQISHLMREAGVRREL